MSKGLHKLPRKYKIVGIIVILLVLYLIFNAKNKPETFTNTESPQNKNEEKTPLSISITGKEIKEENFIATYPVISGSGLLVEEANKYVTKTIEAFKVEANKDVPGIREKFKEDIQYEIEIQAQEVEGTQTRSIIISTSTYTGGANTNQVYKVITASHEPESILFLSDLVKKENQSAFTQLVKKELKNKGEDVFAEEVDDLQFNSFTNWSLDNKNLTIYFDKYQIAPGALGPVAFPLSLIKVKNLLNPEFI